MRHGLPLLLALLVACVDKGPDPVQRQIDPAYIQKNLLAEPPARMTNPVNADLGGKVMYLGNDVEATTVSPGSKVKVVHYWKVTEPPGATWRVFTHLTGSNRTDWMNLDATDMRIGHGPAKWKAGDIIRDEQEFSLPDQWTSPYAQLVVGLHPKGGQTVKDRMPIVSGPADQESRVPVVRFRVERKPSKPTPAYVIRKASGAIAVDGRADEEAWNNATKSPDFATGEGSPAMAGKTSGRLLWDDTHLYVFVQSEDADVYSPYHNQDDPLWKEDVVELFIDADRNGRGYVELQVNPNNAHFDAWFATTRAGGSQVEWNAGMSSAVIVHGTADHRSDKDTGWDAEIAIPWAAVKGNDPSMRVTLPPRIGDKWRLNVVRIDKPASDTLAVASWNPITYQDFHALGRMLDVDFGDAQGVATPATTPPGPEAEATSPQGAPPGTTPGAPGSPAPAPDKASGPGSAAGNPPRGQTNPAVPPGKQSTPAAPQPAPPPGSQPK